MFTKTKNIDTAFRHIKLFSIVLIVANVLMFFFYVYQSEKRVTAAESKVLILLNGSVVSAMVSDRVTNLPVEAKNHVKVFHSSFFTLSPDDKLIQANTTKALYLADESAKRIYDDFKEGNYYSNIISSNVSQTVIVDSISVNTSSYPIAFRFYGKQEITRATTVTIRSLVTEGYLRNTAKSDNNPHGFLIERWHILENKDLEVKNR